MENDNPTLGPNREMNEKARSKIFKIYAGGIYHIKVPVDPKNVPEEELKYLDDERKRNRKDSN